MQTLSLNGPWKMYYGPEIPGKSNPETLEDAILADYTSIPATVPCEAQRALVEAGLYPDPFVDENLYHFRKLEFYRFFFTRTFDYTPFDEPGRIVLQFDGLDTLATVFLNDQIVGTADNMLISHTFDVTDTIIPGKNTLTVRLDSAINSLRDKDIAIAVHGCEQFGEQVLLRKPGHSFGWDIAPRLVTAGIWRDVTLKLLPETRITQAYFHTTHADQNRAHLRLKYTLTTNDPFLEDLTLTVTGVCGESQFSLERKVVSFTGQVHFSVENPQLWFPVGYGSPNLYSVTLALKKGQVTLYTEQLRIGIRTVKLDAVFKKGDEGRFTLYVNNTPIFVKGSNWVPLDAFHSRDLERTEKAIELLYDCGCNTVRCWGGNVYESDLFFDLCDEKGLLVWQDFSMGCGIYPRDEVFRKTLAKEAESVVKRLRNHASLVLWCGDNENDCAYFWAGQTHPHSRNNPLTRQVIPDVLADHDPYRPYIPSSPYLTLDMQSDTDGPEQHSWGPRDYFKGDFYRNIDAHFISEIGYHGCPAPESLAKFIPKDQLHNRRGTAWTTHNTDYRESGVPRGYDRIELMEKQVDCLFGNAPKELPSFALASQFTQAEAKKFFIETARILKPRRMGLIWWNLLDCWPQISDAVVDYYFNKKIAYEYITRSQAPVCLLCAEEKNNCHQVILANDGNQSGWAVYKITNAETGELIASGSAYTEANVNLPLCQIPAAAKGETIFYRLTVDVNGIVAENHYVSFHAPLNFDRYAKVYHNTLKTL